MFPSFVRHFRASKFQYTRGSLLLKQTRATDLPLELAPSYQTSLGRYTRGSLLPQHAPATRSWSKAPSSAPTISSDMLRNKTFAPEFCSLVSNWFDMREQAPGANLLHESVLGASSLVCTEICLPCKSREQTFCCATYFFARNRWCRRGNFAPGACCRSVLRGQAPSSCPSCVLVVSFSVPRVYRPFDMREQNSGAKVLLRNIFFRKKSLVQTRELCSGSVLQERAAGASSLVCTGLKVCECSLIVSLFACLFVLEARSKQMTLFATSVLSPVKKTRLA